MASTMMRHSSRRALTALNSSQGAIRHSAWKARLVPSLTSATVPTDTFDAASSSSVPLADRIARAGVPFVAQEGFTAEAVLRGCKESNDGDLREVDRATLEALFPDRQVPTVSLLLNRLRRSAFSLENDPTYRSEGQAVPVDIGVRRALVNEWLAEGRRSMARMVQARGLTVEKDGDEGIFQGLMERLRWNETVPRSSVIEALGLLISQPPSSSSFPLPHVFRIPTPVPYFTQSLSLATSLLHALQDYSPSGEWQLRRLRYGLVWSAAELGSLRLRGAEKGEAGAREVEGMVKGLLARADKGARGIRDTVEFAEYVKKSQVAIWRSFGL